MNAARRVVERAVSNAPGSRGISRRESEIAVPRIADLMGKPFLTAEITVKALTYALRGRLQKLKMAENLILMPKQAEQAPDNLMPALA
jgi:hypothetical protein